MYCNVLCIYIHICVPVCFAGSLLFLLLARFKEADRSQRHSTTSKTVPGPQKIITTHCISQHVHGVSPLIQWPGGQVYFLDRDMSNLLPALAKATGNLYYSRSTVVLLHHQISFQDMSLFAPWLSFEKLEILPPSCRWSSDHCFKDRQDLEIVPWSFWTLLSLLAKGQLRLELL